MVGSHFRADIKDLRDSGAAAESVSRTVKKHVGAGHLREAGLALPGSGSKGTLGTLAAQWERWGKTWTDSMTDYGESLKAAAKDYEAHDAKYSHDFKNVQDGMK